MAARTWLMIPTLAIFSQTVSASHIMLTECETAEKRNGAHVMTQGSGTTIYTYLQNYHCSSLLGQAVTPTLAWSCMCEQTAQVTTCSGCLCSSNNLKQPCN